ncbi:MAG: SRPBCC domain-containing protein [Rhizobium sp.]|nr:SRPBCC domain-containing protein [Rhizobium sp.]
MYGVRTEIEINSSSERVWSILTNFPDYGSWNPFVTSISGRAHAGERLTISISHRAGKRIVFRPKVLVAIPESELRWMGRVLVPGIFDGEHYFRVVPIGSNRVLFIHGEIFSGLLAGVMKSSLSRELKLGFGSMNHALKARAEALATE